MSRSNRRPGRSVLVVSHATETPIVTEASVTGKTFYRVRMGTYKSIEAANDAKAEFEKAAKKSASVMKL